MAQMAYVRVPTNPLNGAATVTIDGAVVVGQQQSVLADVNLPTAKAALAAHTIFIESLPEPDDAWTPNAAIPITVTGSKGGNAALASLNAALVSIGLITDTTT
jgi:hypothetical protein